MNGRIMTNRSLIMVVVTVELEPHLLQCNPFGTTAPGGDCLEGLWAPPPIWKTVGREPAQPLSTTAIDLYKIYQM